MSVSSAEFRSCFTSVTATTPVGSLALAADVTTLESSRAGSSPLHPRRRLAYSSVRQTNDVQRGPPECGWPQHPETRRLVERGKDLIACGPRASDGRLALCRFPDGLTTWRRRPTTRRHPRRGSGEPETGRSRAGRVVPSFPLLDGTRRHDPQCLAETRDQGRCGSASDRLDGVFVPPPVRRSSHPTPPLLRLQA